MWWKTTNYQLTTSSYQVPVRQQVAIEIWANDVFLPNQNGFVPSLFFSNVVVHVKENRLPEIDLNLPRCNHCKPQHMKGTFDQQLPTNASVSLLNDIATTDSSWWSSGVRSKKHPPIQDPPKAGVYCGFLLYRWVGRNEGWIMRISALWRHLVVLKRSCRFCQRSILLQIFFGWVANLQSHSGKEEMRE